MIFLKNFSQIGYLSLLGSIHALLSWKELENSLTSKNYDLAPWTYTGEVTRITTHLIFTHVQSPAFSELGFSFHLIQEWKDVRLKYNHSYVHFAGKYVLLNVNKFDLIWTPDSYITNAISEMQHGVINPNVFIRIYPNGTLVKSTRLTVRTPCPLTPVGFPRGSQTCTMGFESYSFTTSEVSMIWRNYNPFEFRDDFSTSGLALNSVKRKNCLQESREYPCLKLQIEIVRDFSQLILRIYVPSVFVVILGWISMWIDKGQVAARTSLGVLCVLSIVTQLVGVVSIDSELEGVIAVDIWMAVCMFFTIKSLFVFILVHNMKRRKDKMKERYKDNSETTDVRFESAWCDIRYGTLQNVFRVVYPVLFIAFNIVYWTFFLSVY
ncbi:glutamate-gated chloride channel-like [Saccostrea cucullata]|uniref:glutamate-gated chloride channel-like n=1 Tax=Saccostrea cuccullata TaxID=36930 RepID=UPI002ED47C14